MIFSKGNLLPVKMTRNDKAIPVLDNVHFRRDGSTVGTNGMAVLAVSPVMSNIKDKCVVEKGEEKRIDEDVTVTAETVREVLRNVGRDTKYGGILEHVSFDGKYFTLQDESREKKIQARRYWREYIEYQSIFQKAVRQGTSNRVVLNLRRLISVLKCIDEICPDSAQDTPVYIQFTEGRDVLFRAINPRTGQRVLAVFKSYEGVEGRWPEMSTWEKTICGLRKIIGKIRKSKEEVCNE